MLILDIVTLIGATPISITVSGNNTVSWYLKQNSTNEKLSLLDLEEATNYPANISPNECYTLLILQGDDETYSITDELLQIVLFKV